MEGCRFNIEVEYYTVSCRKYTFIRLQFKEVNEDTKVLSINMENILIEAGFSTVGVAVLLIVYKVLKTAMGKKCISSCCGRRMEAGFDIGTMTPSSATVVPIVVP